MTTEQLIASGVPQNTWMNLGKLYKRILFSNEATNFIPDDNLSRYYFDSSNGLLYARFFNGITHSTNQNKYCKEIIDSATNEPIYAEVISGGMINSTVGLYHEVYDVAEITILQ